MPLPRTARHAVALVATLAPLMLIVGTAHAGVVSVAGPDDCLQRRAR